MTRSHSLESLIKQYLLESVNRYFGILNKKNPPHFKVSSLSKEWSDLVYARYESYKNSYKECFAGSITDVKLDEHKVIAILIVSVLEIGIPKDSFTGHPSFFFNGDIAFTVMIFFLLIHYKDLAKNGDKYKKLLKKSLSFPEKMNGESYKTQFIKSLHYSKEIGKENLSILFLSNVIFFIDHYNQNSIS